ncbi:DUF3408 domain-containing protein [Agriterribacter sp.]|uniref:DUF3408 domain-containing protein n=1 Tax=Agriterribacter sp. TaxID=2821509 RepID=UPI002BF9AB56|nr:DUF3408 domain-containing protein [Agriterribacter sp.]HRO46310.1 DUF3408 domain-containing protein [Agriterribacter sp.]HRQ19240.1 DUF3408 domain-containing protein [Agriterribacter sp.]
MATEKSRKDFDKPNVDEEYLMNIMSGEATAGGNDNTKQEPEAKETKSKEKYRSSSSKKIDYDDIFLVNRYPSGRNGKVVYIRPEFHERLLRIVQLAREDKTTLYSYIDNILDYHFREFGTDITAYFTGRFKPIL